MLSYVTNIKNLFYSYVLGDSNYVIKDLNGKVAVITGGSKGIGSAIAERFGQEGNAVVIKST